MRKSNWIMKPQGSGWKFKKYLSCHHLARCLPWRLFVKWCTFPNTHFPACSFPLNTLRLENVTTSQGSFRITSFRPVFCKPLKVTATILSVHRQTFSQMCFDVPLSWRSLVTSSIECVDRFLTWNLKKASWQKETHQPKQPFFGLHVSFQGCKYNSSGKISRTRFTTLWSLSRSPAFVPAAPAASRGTNLHEFTLPETNSSPLKMMVSNRNLLFQGSIFRCYVSFREGTFFWFGPVFRGCSC